MKTNEKLSRSIQSVHLATYDSGFVDEQAVESSMTTSHPANTTDVHLSLDEILLTKSEDEDDDGPSATRQKWKNGPKRVSFQGKNVKISKRHRSFSLRFQKNTSFNVFHRRTSIILLNF